MVSEDPQDTSADANGWHFVPVGHLQEVLVLILS